MNESSVLFQFIFSFFAATGFSIFLNVPPKQLGYCGFTGAIGWTVYFLIKSTTLGPVIASFVAAIVVSIFGEYLARKLKKPAILFIIPGIIPLVPGLGMYNTMLNLVQSNYVLATEYGTRALLIGGAISMAMLIVTSANRSLLARKEKLKAKLKQKRDRLKNNQKKQNS